MSLSTSETKNSFVYFFLGILLAPPFFLEIGLNNSFYIQLPQSFYTLDGIPFHIGTITIIILLLNFKLKLIEISILLLLLLYLFLSYMIDGFDRSIHAIQSIYFILWEIYFLNRTYHNNRVSLI